MSRAAGLHGKTDKIKTQIQIFVKEKKAHSNVENVHSHFRSYSYFVLSVGALTGQYIFNIETEMKRKIKTNRTFLSFLLII